VGTLVLFLILGKMVVSDDFLDFFGVGCYWPFLISDFTDLGFFSSLHFRQVCQGSVTLIYFFKEPVFYFIDSLYGLFFCFYFIDFSP
jgi:hypothetical protein